MLSVRVVEGPAFILNKTFFYQASCPVSSVKSVGIKDPGASILSNLENSLEAGHFQRNKAVLFQA
jgi:hypothetical protein